MPPGVDTLNGAVLLTRTVRHVYILHPPVSEARTVEMWQDSVSAHHSQILGSQLPDWSKEILMAPQVPSKGYHRPWRPAVARPDRPRVDFQGPASPWLAGQSAYGILFGDELIVRAAGWTGDPASTPGAGVVKAGSTPTECPCRHALAAGTPLSLLAPRRSKRPA